MTSGLKQKTWVVLLTVLVAVMAIEIGYLVYQNQKLRSIIEDPRKYFSTLSEKDIVPTVSLMDTAGETVMLSYSADAPFTILFWFMPGCPGCEENYEFWRRLASENENERIRFYGMCIGDAGETIAYAEEQGFSFPIMCVNDQYLVESYKGGVVPQTVLIAPEGVVLGTWPGVMEDSQKDKLLSHLRQFKSKDS